MFFFQAEDGIRDIGVTGVQTCALPISLEQYAWTRVHGAVLDEMRRQDWAPRSVRRWESDSEKAAEELVAINQRRTTRNEIADSLGITLDELRERRADLATSDVTSLNAPVLSDDASTIETVDTIASEDARLDPELEGGRTQAKELFRQAFATLPEREREIAVLLYV